MRNFKAAELGQAVLADRQSPTSARAVEGRGADWLARAVLKSTTQRNLIIFPACGDWSTYPAVVETSA